MRQMWQTELRPRLAGRPGGGVIVSRTLKVLGLGESAAEQIIKGLLACENPTIGTYAKQDGIHLRLTAKAADEAAARALIAPMEAKIRHLLRRTIYGVDGDTPAKVVRDLLGQAGLTVGTAEYGTGGALMALLEEAGGRSYPGGLSFTGPGGLSAVGLAGDEAHWASEAGASDLAREARKRCGASLGLGAAGALISGTPGAGGAPTAWVALDDGSPVQRTASMTYATAVSEMRRLAALAALNLLRLWLLDHSEATGSGDEVQAR
jgi:nicotinamide-nucleotide amidase